MSDARVSYTDTKILLLNSVEIDSTRENDFGAINARRLAKTFQAGYQLHYTDLIRSIGIRATEALIEATIVKHGISLVFFAPNGDNYELSLEFFNYLSKDLNVKVVMWVYDDEMIFETLTKYYAQVVDLAVTCDFFAVSGYRRLGTPALHYFSSYDKYELFPVNVERDFEVSFVGDCTKSDRATMIKFLKKNGIDVKTFGKGSDGGFISSQEMSKVFSRSKINLNFTKVDQLGLSAWFLGENTMAALMRQAKGRPMEVAMTRSFCLSEYSPSLGETFVDGEEIEQFKTPEDLLAKVRHYLVEDTKRERIARAAYKKATEQFEAGVLFPKLAQTICDIVEESSRERRSEQRLLYRDTVFKKNHLIRLTILLFVQISRSRLREAVETFGALFQYGGMLFVTAFVRGMKISLFKSLRAPRIGELFEKLGLIKQ